MVVSNDWIYSPNLLKLSGVGTAAQLRTCLSEHGIAAEVVQWGIAHRSTTRHRP